MADNEYIAADKSFRKRGLLPTGRIENTKGGVGIEYTLHNVMVKDKEPSYLYCICDKTLRSNGSYKAMGVNVYIAGESWDSDNDPKWETYYESNTEVRVEKEVELLFNQQYPKVFDKKLYLMKNTRNGYTKIGISNNPKHREKTLQSEEPEVELLFTMSVCLARLEEKALHKEYNDKRVRGEWFDLTDNDVMDIIKKYK